MLVRLSPVFGSVLHSPDESPHGSRKSVGERLCRSVLEMANQALGASSKVQLEQEASSGWLAVVSGDSASSDWLDSPPTYGSQTTESLSEESRFLP